MKPSSVQTQALELLPTLLASSWSDRLPLSQIADAESGQPGRDG